MQELNDKGVKNTLPRLAPTHTPTSSESVCINTFVSWVVSFKES